MLESQAIEWARQRGISEGILNRMRVESGMAQFGSDKVPSIVFGYYNDGERVNYKARSLAEKKYKQQSGGEQRFYNLDQVLYGSMDAVWITEGEVDSLSLLESTITNDNQVLSVPTGAPSEESDNPHEARKYQYVIDALGQGLNEATKFIIAVDNDEPGRALRNDLVAILGAAKCWFVDWPDGIKDANEYLIEYGADDLRKYLAANQVEWPVSGIYTLDKVPEPPKLETWECGFDEWEGKIKLAARTLSVVTGTPGSGKTHFMLQVWFNIAKRYGIRIGILSAETGIKPHVRKFMRQFYHGKAQHNLTDEEKKEADNFIQEHFIFIAHPNSRPSVSWVLDIIEVCSIRYSCRAIMIDPWNKLESDYDRRTKNETQWVGECLDNFLDISRAFDLHVQIIAHPAKPGDIQKRNVAVDLYSISGSAHWNNRVDQGFVCHRPKLNNKDGSRCFEMEFRHAKSRFDELGWPCNMAMKLDDKSGNFKSIEYESYLEKMTDG